MLDFALAIVEPARRVPCLGGDVLERDGEVDQVQVEVVDAPVGKLLLGDGLNLVIVVEGLPQLGDDEEVRSLYEAVFDGAGNALSGFDFIAIVYINIVSLGGCRRRAQMFR